jgi:hypothetical protein
MLFVVVVQAEETSGQDLSQRPSGKVVAEEAERVEEARAGDEAALGLLQTTGWELGELTGRRSRMVSCKEVREDGVLVELAPLE